MTKRKSVSLTDDDREYLLLVLGADKEGMLAPIEQIINDYLLVDRELATKHRKADKESEKRFESLAKNLKSLTTTLRALTKNDIRNINRWDAELPDIKELEVLQYIAESHAKLYGNRVKPGGTTDPFDRDVLVAKLKGLLQDNGLPTTATSTGDWNKLLTYIFNDIIKEPKTADTLNLIRAYENRWTKPMLDPDFKREFASAIRSFSRLQKERLERIESIRNKP